MKTRHPQLAGVVVLGLTLPSAGNAAWFHGNGVLQNAVVLRANRAPSSSSSSSSARSAPGACMHSSVSVSVHSTEVMELVHRKKVRRRVARKLLPGVMEKRKQEEEEQRKNSSGGGSDGGSDSDSGHGVSGKSEGVSPRDTKKSHKAAGPVKGLAGSRGLSGGIKQGNPNPGGTKDKYGKKGFGDSGVFSYVCRRDRLVAWPQDDEEEGDGTSAPSETEGRAGGGNGAGRVPTRSRRAGGLANDGDGASGMVAVEVSRMSGMHGRHARDPTMLKDNHFHHTREYIWQAATKDAEGFDYDNDIDGDDVGSGDDLDPKDPHHARHRHHQQSHPDMPDSQVYASHAMAYRYVAHEDVDSLRVPKDILGFWLGDRHCPTVHDLWSTCSPKPITPIGPVNVRPSLKGVGGTDPNRVVRLVERVKTLAADVVQMALSEEDILNDWDKTPDGCLAKIIVLGELAPMVKQDETRFCRTVRQYRARQLAKKARRQWASKYTPVEMFWVLKPLMGNGAARIDRRQGAQALRSILADLNHEKMVIDTAAGMQHSGGGGGGGIGHGDGSSGGGTGGGEDGGKDKHNKKDKKAKEKGWRKRGKGKGAAAGGDGHAAVSRGKFGGRVVLMDDGGVQVDGMILTQDMSDFMEKFLSEVEKGIRLPNPKP